jgi:CheY-like chemotaxis protein
MASRILVVDDNADAADSLAIILRLDGHEVQTVYHAAAALDVARDFHPDVVLLDLGLPGRMSGYDLAVPLRQLPGLENVLLVAVTGFGREEDRERAFASGIQVFLIKPVDPVELKALLNR